MHFYSAYGLIFSQQTLPLHERYTPSRTPLSPQQYSHSGIPATKISTKPLEIVCESIYYMSVSFLVPSQQEDFA